LKGCFESHLLALWRNWDKTVNIVEACQVNRIDILFSTGGLNAPRSGPVLLIRWMVGLVFLSEGIQKFLFPMQLGVGRFMKIGLPMADWLAPMVGAFEVTCGLLIILGILTRWAALPLLVIILTALATTKWPILLNEGFWEMAHEARTDYAMLMGLLFLIWTHGRLTDTVQHSARSPKGDNG
jgi:putative oxidoreductase